MIFVMVFEIPTSMNLPTIPEQEMEISFVRSSGPGGQNVNKRSTKAQLRWNVEASAAFSSEQKTLIRERLANRLNRGGELFVECDEMRSQKQNRDRALEIARSLVADALAPDIARVPTKPTHSAKERRLDDKARQSQKKRERKGEW